MKTPKAQKTPAKADVKAPTPAPAPAKETKPVAVVKKKAAPAQGKFGCRVGSQANAINVCLCAKPQTVEAIAKATGLRTARIVAHVKFLLGKSLIAAGKDGTYAPAK